MTEYLSLVFLYNRASYKKILLVLGVIPLSFLVIFLLRIGDPNEAGSEMLMERAFGGVWAVIIFIAVNLLGLMSVANSLNGRKALKATHATTGYTIRRLRLSPVSSYLTVFFYYLAVILILWGLAIASLYVIGKVGLTMAGAAGIDTKLALGLLRTDIGHALIPIAHPALIIFDIASILALAGECAKSCYLSWHNGRPSAGVILVLVPMFLVWINILEDTYIFMATIIIVVYTAISFGDVIFREKRPKGDPFKANQYAGIMDMDDFEFDDSVYAPEVNSLVEVYGIDSPEKSVQQLYGRETDNAEKKGVRKIDLGRIRRRFMPLGINLERANTLFGAWIFIGIAAHLIFYFKFITHLKEIDTSIKGISIASGVEMPYFWELQEHSYYGYIIGILMVVFLQAYWNYEYYNKKTKSVYVMKRLPDRKEYLKTIWIAPIIQGCCIAMIMIVNIVIDLCVYLVATPEIALHADYMAHILPF